MAWLGARCISHSGSGSSSVTDVTDFMHLSACGPSRYGREEHTNPETTSDIEHDLSSAVHMVHIAVTMVEKALRAAQESVTGRPDTYHVNAEDVDALLRALYETRNQVRAARDRYLRGPTDAL
jgi:hypothetical protein